LASSEGYIIQLKRFTNFCCH